MIPLTCAHLRAKTVFDSVNKSECVLIRRVASNIEKFDYCGFKCIGPASCSTRKQKRINHQKKRRFYECDSAGPCAHAEMHSYRG